MSSFAAARSAFRSTCSARTAASRFAFKSQPKTSGVPTSLNRKPLSHSILRRPVRMSFCVESMMPYHTVTASALMTSMLSISRGSCGWLLEACNDDV